MTMLKIGEGHSVQFPMVKHAVEIGWTPLTQQEAEVKRRGRANMLFRDDLEAKLLEFNPWLGDIQSRTIVDAIEALPPTIEGNRDVLSWIRGERQWYDEKEERHRPIRVVDFDDPGSNSFVVTWEWKIEPLARKGNRADVMFVINGLPVAVVEHKNPKDGGALDRAVKQLRRYQLETPELLAAPQLFNVTHLIDYWYGVTWNVNRRFIAKWKQTADEEYRFAVQAFFEPTDFLRTLRHWILFYIEDGETRKSVLREHQRRAVDKIVARCADPEKTRGLIWHTQGSGKTFTLLIAARLVLEDKARFSNGTVILVVDRSELEGQLREWVDRLLGEMRANDIAVRRANSRAELQELLDADFRGLIISMIHKFEEIRKDTSPRGNFYVFIDEAHRSVAKDLGSYLMAALPGATIIGFTGTPVGDAEGGSGSFQIFGAQDEDGYLDKYSIQESIEDGTTLPIRYMMAPSHMTIPAGQLDEEFFALAESEDVTDVEELNRVLDRAVGIRAFLSADDRVEQVAEFVARHFRENVDPLHHKAFLVAVDRETCAKYKVALDRHLPPQWTEVVYSSNPSDSVDRPKVAELQLSETREQEVRRAFKKTAEQPRILIVTDKLLTGYDAPVLSSMYLDKPMRDHVLLQAIARVNRPYVDGEGVHKRVGLVVDFVGVLRELRKALRFDSADIDDSIEDLKVMMEDLHRRIGRAAESYLQVEAQDGPDRQLEKVVYGRFLDPDARKTFFDDYKDVEALWEILSPAAGLRDHIVTYKRLSQLYAAVRNAYSETGGFLGDLEYKTRRLIESSAEQAGLGRIAKVVTFDLATLESLKGEDGPEEGKVYNLLRGLRKEMDEDPARAVVLRALKERADQVIRDLEERKTTGMAAMDEIAALVVEKEATGKAARDSGLSAVGFAVHWLLGRDEALHEAGLDTLVVAREVETLLDKFPNWRENSDEQRRLRLNLYKPVIRLPDEQRRKVVEQIMKLLEQTVGS
ncbi:HsdR family type I site-specific deoxyribonuclease [Streptomyces sp. NPDC002044]|uniref:type I restriction endonuclease subunit R n=1 Tax=Streptomyces sp. NPDC002044 TaxID=3154662 RepID=UPI00331F00BA